MKPKLLIVELWGLGDLAIATPFIRAATGKFEVTVLAKSYAKDLQARFWPGVNVMVFHAPWTAFKHKYRLYRWPWRDMFRLHREVRRGGFDVGLSARWDPRDHFLLALAGVRERLGFPRVRSRVFLTHSLVRPSPEAHRYEHWRVIGEALGLKVPGREQLGGGTAKGNEVLIHTGAGQPVRVWPLERHRQLTARLRQAGHRVQIACDPDQHDWWLRAGEAGAVAPRTVTQLMTLIDRAGAFIGNDSGPGHLAALAGVPTFTIFGPQLPGWFAPLHPEARWTEGKACPYKPCSDYCRWPEPLCLTRLSEEEVWGHVRRFMRAGEIHTVTGAQAG